MRYGNLFAGNLGRFLRQKLMAGVLGTIIALALLSPAILSFVPVAAAYAGVAGPAPSEGLREAFPTLFPNGMWLLALIAIWIALIKTGDQETILEPMPRGETVGWLFLCIPLAGFVLAELRTHAFLGRYFISVLPGVAIAFACCLRRHAHQARRVSLGILLLLATYGVAKQVIATRHPDLNGPAPHDAKLEDTLRKEGKQFFLITNQARYLEALHYSKHPEKYAYLISLDSGDKHQTMALARYYPMQFWTLEDIKKHARRDGVGCTLSEDCGDLEAGRDPGGDAVLGAAGSLLSAMNVPNAEFLPPALEQQIPRGPRPARDDNS